MSRYADNYPEHDRSSCDDSNLANIDPDGSGCRRCNALALDQRESLLGALQTLEVAANTAHRCYTHRPGNFAVALESLRAQSVDARALVARYRARFGHVTPPELT